MSSNESVHGATFRCYSQSVQNTAIHLDKPK